MAFRIIKQPNGLLALFEDPVDDFVVMDMSHDEAIEELMQRHRMHFERAELKVHRGEIDEPVPGFVERTANDGLDRWRDALETIRFRHGEAVVQERLDMIDF